MSGMKLGDVGESHKSTINTHVVEIYLIYVQEIWVAMIYTNWVVIYIK